MTNGEKYKTAKERAEAYSRFCHNNTCSKCVLKDNRVDYNTAGICAFSFLDIEAEEEKPLPCPFCGRECVFDTKTTSFKCTNCNYVSGGALMHESSIVSHNRVAKAVKESEAK